MADSDRYVVYGHFFSTQPFPDSSYSCFEIHICWKEPWNEWTKEWLNGQETNKQKMKSLSKFKKQDEVDG